MNDGSSLSGRGTISRVILLIDIDCFYAQAEQIRDPRLRGKPVGVRQKGLVITTSYEARARGIRKGESLAEVKKKCPDIVIKNGEDLCYYTELSIKWRKLIANMTPPGTAIEPQGLDEVFVDATKVAKQRLKGPDTLERLLEIGAEVCQELRETTKRELNLETSAGISTNKLFAKLVASHRKPFGQTTFLPSSSHAIYTLIPDDALLTTIPGLGFSSARQLANCGIKTVSDCRFARPASTEYTSCRSLLIHAQQLCQGQDDSPVRFSKGVQSVGVEQSYRLHPLQPDTVDTELKALADKLVRKWDALQLQSDHAVPTNLTVTWRSSPLDPKTQTSPRALTSALSTHTPSREESTYTTRQSRRARFTVLPTASTFRTELSQTAKSLLPSTSYPFINLSLGLALTTAKNIKGIQDQPSLDSFLIAQDSTHKIIPKAILPSTSASPSKYLAPAADDVDDAVLAALPAEIRNDIERELRLAAKVQPKKKKKTQHIDEQGKASFFSRHSKAVAASSASTSSGTADSLAALTAMGFGESESRCSLERFNGMLAPALEDLLSS